jgi:hypothetical protein
MGFRLRRSARLGPLRFNFFSGGLSSISVGGRGASFNIPVNRSGGPRTTVGLPGTGLSWSVEHTPSEGLPNSRRLRPGPLDVLAERPGHLEAQAVGAAFSAGVTLPIRITAPTLEELQHEAREALINHLEQAHCTFRSIRPVGRRPAALYR